MGLKSSNSWTALSRTLIAGGLAAAALAAVPSGAQGADRVGLNGAPCAYETIGDAIADAVEGDIVFVSPGTYDETLGFIDFDLSIVGAGAACSGAPPAGSTSVFIDGGGSGATFGGSVELVDAELILSDLTIRDARAEADGGLVYVDGGILDLTRVGLIGGFADGDGGAIAGVNDATIIVDDSFFLDNEAGSNGGAISIDGGTLTVQESEMFGALTPADKDSQVHAGNGGLVAIQGGAVATIAETRLFHARASSDGGAIYLSGSSSELNFDGGSVDGNYAASGGAISQSGGTEASIDDVDFSGNDGIEGSTLDVEAPIGSLGTQVTVRESSMSGGTRQSMVHVEGPVKLSIFDSSVTGFHGTGISAVHVESGVVLTMRRSSVVGNVIGTGHAAGISASNSTVLLVDSVISDNFGDIDSHGGIKVAGGTLTLVQTSVTNNRADFVGGLHASGAVIRLVDSVVANNRGGFVGGISIGGDSELFVESTTIADNESTGFFFAQPPSSQALPSAINAMSSVDVDVENTIIWGNESDAGAIGVNQNLAQWRSSDVQDSGGSASWDTALGFDQGSNIDADPQLDDRFIPGADSPVRNTGNSSLLPIDTYDIDDDGEPFEQLPLDFAGRARIRGPQVDMGALERPDRQFILDRRPCIFYDSIGATGTLGGIMNGGETRTIQATGMVPAAQGVTNSCIEPGADAGLFLTFAGFPMAAGNLRLSAANVVPNGGVVNYGSFFPGFSSRLFNSNVVPSELSSGGFLDLTANGGASGAGQPSVSPTLRSVGYFIDEVPAAETPLDFFPLTPCAVFDSRPTQGSTGGFVGPFSTDTQLVVDVTGSHPVGQGGGSTDCGVPDDAEGVIVNLVAVASTGFGYVGALKEPSTTLSGLANWAGLPANNAVSSVIPIADDGSIAVSVDVRSGGTHVRAVVLGYVDDTAGLQFNPLPPCAAFDSRSMIGATGGFAGPRTSGSPTTYQIAGAALPVAQGGNNGGDCGVPETARSVMVNLVAVDSVASGNLRADAAGSTPTGGVLNFASSPPWNNSNAVAIPLDALGRMDVFANGGPIPDGTPMTNVRGVILGYFD